ncbi:histidine kinase dimerization/phospho-acceptor domain-containing protein [Heyndrickxia sporothermodurans]
MAIKWKNRMVICLITLLLFTFGLMSLISLVTRSHEYLFKTYFDTEQFQEEYQAFIDNLGKYELNGMTNEEAKSHLFVTAEEIEEYRNEYGVYSERVKEIMDDYEIKMNTEKSEEGSKVNDGYLKERDQKLEEAKKIFYNDDYVKKKIIDEKGKYIDEYYRTRDNDLSQLYESKKVFKYYLTDIETGEVYTNYFTNDEDQIYSTFSNKEMAFIQSFPSKEGNNLVTVAPPGLDDTVKRLSGKVGVVKKGPENSSVMINYHHYPQKQMAFYLYVVSGLGALIVSIYMMRRLAPFRLGASIKKYYKWIPMDICLIILVLTISIGMVFLNGISNTYLDDHFFVSDFIFMFILSVFFVAIVLGQINLLFGRFSNSEDLKEEFRGCLLFKMYLGLKEAFLNKSIGIQTLILFILPLIFIPAAITVGSEPEFIIICMILFLIVVIPIIVLIVKRAGYFNRILENTSELAKGNLEPDLLIVGRSPLAELAGNINRLKHGVKTSKKEQAKSERLKTELITNVSHDLRTPLTSIITYTELLKNPSLGEEEKSAYVEIIDRKSKRLKVLIDDLFEASKMASGNIDLVLEKVDINQLLKQALAEYDELISQSTLQFRVSLLENPVYAYVDGQKFWRVFDNLIGNILKYALEQTRVYLSIKEINERVLITFKNVSKYELSESSDELFERFKRGDTSRHTDGSGLGLAIAKSIVDLHEGKMDIEVDGDLFKITIDLKRFEK